MASLDSGGPKVRDQPHSAVPGPPTPTRNVLNAFKSEVIFISPVTGPTPMGKAAHTGREASELPLFWLPIYIRPDLGRKQMAHSNWVIWGELNKGASYKGVDRMQGDHRSSVISKSYLITPVPEGSRGGAVTRTCWVGSVCFEPPDQSCDHRSRDVASPVVPPTLRSSAQDNHWLNPTRSQRVSKPLDTAYNIDQDRGGWKVDLEGQTEKSSILTTLLFRAVGKNGALEPGCLSSSASCLLLAKWFWAS